MTDEKLPSLVPLPELEGGLCVCSMCGKPTILMSTDYMEMLCSPECLYALDRLVHRKRIDWMATAIPALREIADSGWSTCPECLRMAAVARKALDSES